MNWIETFKCRCSGIHKIMANSRSNRQLTEIQAKKLAEYRSKIERGMGLTPNTALEYGELCEKEANGSKVVLSDTCIEYLMEVYSENVLGKRAYVKEFWEVDQITKGKLCEEDSIRLLSVVEGEQYFKNTERVENEFLSGEPDIFVGEAIMKAKKITDIKSAFDAPSFLKKISLGGLENGWEEQVQGYCDITDAPEGEIAHCLVNLPVQMMADFRRKLSYRMDVISEESPEFRREWDLFENDMTFTNIPVHQRVFKVKVEPFSEFQRQKVYDRVKVCREWLFNFDKMYQSINLPVEEAIS